MAWLRESTRADTPEGLTRSCSRAAGGPHHTVFPLILHVYGGSLWDSVINLLRWLLPARCWPQNKFDYALNLEAADSPHTGNLAQNTQHLRNSASPRNR